MPHCLLVFDKDFKPHYTVPSTSPHPCPYTKLRTNCITITLNHPGLRTGWYYCEIRMPSIVLPLPPQLRSINQAEQRAIFCPPAIVGFAWIHFISCTSSDLVQSSSTQHWPGSSAKYFQYSRVQCDSRILKQSKLLINYRKHVDCEDGVLGFVVPLQTDHLNNLPVQVLFKINKFKNSVAVSIQCFNGGLVNVSTNLKTKWRDPHN